MTDRGLPIEQIGLFRDRYPGGFSGQAYVLHRTERRLPVLQRAASIAEQLLGALAQDADYGRIIRELCELFASSSLVPAGEIASLLTLPEHAEDELCNHFARLLFGVDPFAMRFEGWIDALRRSLGREPSWQLVTAPLALVKPDWYVCVQPSLFRRQAKAMSPGLVPYCEPSASTYEQYNAMAHTIADQLRGVGLSPADLFDVYDFIAETLPDAFAVGSGECARPNRV